MKARKTLELTFPKDFYATMFVWDRYHMFGGYNWTREGDVIRIQVQPRRARAQIREEATWIYHATARTLVR